MASNSTSAATAVIEIAQYRLHPREFVAVPATFIALATVAVSLRVYVRAAMLKTFGVDDWLLLLAFVSLSCHNSEDTLI